jgi:hypothetical protein
MYISKLIITLSFLILFGFAEAVCAQSTDQALPTPILSNDINGKIMALDVGDPRATRHFYAFAASPGDLLVTVNSKNLNGDIDLFTAITFRPLMKTTVYASSQSPSVTKGIYLRAHQILILRVEARTPNDDPGTYHIHFGGTFEPFNGGIPVAENTGSPEASTEKTGSNRLSSVGATIPRRPAEVTETAEAKPSPSPEKPAEKAAEATEAPNTETTKPAATNTARRTTTRPARRGTRPPPARTRPAEKKTDTATITQPPLTEPKTEPAEKPELSEQPKPAKTTAEKPSEIAPVEKPRTQELLSQPAGTRLIIEEKDGTRIERPMSTVRRVIVEGPTIVIVLKTGKIERIPMADVARMAIEPQ